MSYNANNKIRHPPVQQQSPFSMGEYSPQAQIPRSPETIMIECNRQNALYKGAGEAGLDSQNNTWLTEFSSGLQLRVGDEVKVHSAFLSSVGVGDLIAWNRAEGSDNQDNKGTWIYSFYGCNDAKNDKREQYNMATNPGNFYFDVDNRPCKLMRNLPNGLDTTANFPLRLNSNSHTHYQDPYCPARILGEDPTTEPQVYGKKQLPLEDGNFRLSFVNNVFNNLTSAFIGQSVLFLDQYKTPHTTPPTYDPYDPRKLFSIGKTYKFYPLALDVDATTAPVGGYYNYNANIGFIFTCYGFIDLTIAGGAGGGAANYNNYAIIMENQNYDKGIYGGTNEPEIIIKLSTGYFQEVNIGGNYSYQDQSPTHLVSNPQVPPNRPLATTFSSLNQISQVGDEVFMVYTPTINQVTPAIPSGGLVLYEEDELVLFEVLESANTNIVLDVLFKELYDPLDGTNHSYATIEFLNPPTPFHTIADLLALNDYINTFGFYLNGDENDNEFMTISTLLGNTTWVSLNTITFTNVLRSVNAPDSDDNYTPNQKGKCILYGMLNNNGFKYRHKGKANQSISSGKPQINVPANGKKDVYTMINTQVLIDNYGSIDNTPKGLTCTSVAYPETTTTIRSSSFGVSLRNALGLEPIDLTNYSQTINGVDEFLNVTNLYKHYSQYTFKIDEDYSSPSDIATELTKQTHIVTPPRNNFGNLLPENIIGNRQIISVPQNNFLLPVWTSAINDFQQDNKESATGLTYTLATGSFLLEANLYNLPAYKAGNTETYTPNGLSHIYFRTKYTCYNKPTTSNTADFNQQAAPIYSAIYNTSGESPADEIGYPIEYIPNQSCFISQYIGSDNVAFIWDASQSRFTISYLHQPQVSTFSISDKSGVETGGQESCVLYFPEPVGKDNYLYKLPQTRNGGVNIENWLGYEITYGMTPTQIRTLTGIDDSVDLSTDWFLGGVNSVNKSNLSERFWTKLGFDDAQFNNIGYNTEKTSGNFIPNATTDGLIDVASGIITLEEPSEDTPFYTTLDSADATAKPVRYAKSSVGALNTNGHAKGYGHANTSGKPAQFTGTPTTDTFLQGALTFNPDRERHTAYTIDCVSTEIVANNLPIKTENGYFLILSDLVDTDFYVSANKGTNLNCVGIISKLNAEGDFYYQYQAPQSFYVKKDKLIGSITIDIRQPDLSIPNAISPYSSVLFQITRYQPVPQSIPQPIWTQQQEFFANLTNSLQQIMEQNKPVKNTPQRTRLAEIMNQVSSAILQTQTEEGEPNLVQRIINNYDRMNLSQFQNDPRGLRQFLLANPEASGFLDDISTIQTPAPTIPTDPEELTEEGLYNYVSQYQPVVSGGGFNADEPPPFLPEADPTIDAKTPADIMRFIINNQKERLLNDQRPLGADDIAGMLGAGATSARIESIMSLGQKMEKNMMEAKTGEKESRTDELKEREEEIRLRKLDQYKDYKEGGGKGQFAKEKKEGLALQDRLSRPAGRPAADRPSYYIKPPDYQSEDDD